MANQTAQQPATSAPPSSPAPQNKGYGKRPLWQWVVLYLVIGGIIYAVVYFFFLSGGAGIPGY